MRSKLRYLTILLVALFAVVAVASADSGSDIEFQPATDVERIPAPVLQPKGAEGPALYIIQLADPAVASYEGGIEGLAATKPAVNGEVKLDAKSDAAQAYAAYLRNRQSAFVVDAEAALNRSVDVQHDYQYAFNGVAFELTPEEAQTVATLPGVLRLERNSLRYPDTDYGPRWIGADFIWDGTATGGQPATQGEGVIVGVIDTGLNMDHPSFADIGGDGYDHTNPFGSGNYVGLCDTDPGTWVCNDKLIGYWIFTGETTEDTDGHGSHTASTSAGNVVTATFNITDTNPFTYTPQISGVAPHANVIGYDACDDTGGCPTVALNDAIDQAVADGVDVINYSIGGGTSDPWSDTNSLTFLGAVDAGVIPVTSAGNDGPGAGTMGSPADAPWMLAVGASTHNRDASNALMDMSGGDTTPPADISGAGLGAPYGPAPIVHASTAGDGQCLNPFPAGTWSGEIVVCDRGSIARVAKGQNVLAGGAGGFVLANVDAQGDSVVADPHVLPGVHIGDSDGDVLRTWLSSGSGHMATIQGTVFDLDFSNGDIMAGFSSRGPNTNNAPGLIKPDVSAPGVSILAAYRSGSGPAGNAEPWMSEYNFVSGTSMASPHTAGAAALLRALYPSWSVSEIHSALMSTGMNDGVLKEDGTTPADPFDIGAGRIDLTKAGEAGLVFDETVANYTDADPAIGGDPTTLNIPSLGNAACVENCSWTRTVRSTAAMTMTWTASTNAPAGMTLTVTPSTFDLAPGATQTLNIDADVSGLPSGAWAFAEVTLNPPAPLAAADFEDGNWPPAGWSSYALSGTEWLTGTTGTAGSHGDPHGGTYYGWHNDVSGAQDAWLVSPSFMATADSELSFWHRNYWVDSGWYGYSGALISTGSCDPNDGEFVELAEYAAAVADWTQETVSLSSYAGQSVCVAFQYTGDWMHEWYLDDIAIHGGGSATPSSHMPVAVVPTSGDLPQLVEINTRRDAGSHPVNDLVAIEITDLYAEYAGLAEGATTDISLSQDPTNGDPYDDLSQVFYTTVTVPAGMARMVAEITASTAPDVDLFWGADTNGNGMPDAGEELGSSTTPSWNEYLNYNQPPAGDYWVLVQNWAESASPPDDIALTLALVSGDAGNMMVEGPTSVPAGTPFDIRVFWDQAMAEGSHWYGAVSLGSSPSSPGDVGTIPVDLYRDLDDVVKTADPMTTTVGSTVNYTLTVRPNIMVEDLTYNISDTLPAGMTYISGTVAASSGTASASGNTIYWTGTMPTPVGAAGNYAVTTSATDPSCDTGFGGYVNLEDFGIFTQPGITGDTTAFTAFTSGDPISFYGDDYTGMSFTDDGFALFDVGANYGGSPWIPQIIPDAAQPNNLAAMLWHDFEIFYDGTNNHGVSLATSGAPGGVVIVEYDDIQFWGGSTDTFDFEVVVSRAVSDVPGAYEIVYAYDNLNGSLTGDFTIGVENAAGDDATALLNNGSADSVISNGFMVCMDYMGPTFDPVTITYQATVDADAAATQTNTADHQTDNPGSMVATASADVHVLQPGIAVTKTVGTDPSMCATESTLTVDQPNTDVTYCYTVENTGDITMTVHDVVDDKLGTLASGLAQDLAPGATYSFTATTNITGTVTNVVTWTAYADTQQMAMATATATVTEQPTDVSLTSFGSDAPMALAPVWLAAALAIVMGLGLALRRKFIGS